MDHQDNGWDRNHYGGAKTYSEDLLKYQIPKWKKVLGKNDIISTCPPPDRTQISGTYRTFIWYLHKYPKKNSIGNLQDSLNHSKIQFDNLIIIASYKEYVKHLVKRGFKAVFIPMSIDVEYIQKFKSKDKKGIVYFGNLYPSKIETYRQIKFGLRSLGISIDTLSKGSFNGIKQINPGKNTYEFISKYKYGIGVGRCALEMWALGLKVLISGDRLGGLVMTERDKKNQIATNCNSRIWTFSNDIKKCYRNLDNSKEIISDTTRIDHVNEVKKLYDL
jgi:hypothetical protein